MAPHLGNRTVATIQMAAGELKRVLSLITSF
jgi:hypothetical protein